ncbi:RteC domain-containing protein [Flavobacteriaceae bacterium]|nr:RteC domain-containing protein [Flavobacteriaceae bacterium]
MEEIEIIFQAYLEHLNELPLDIRKSRVKSEVYQSLNVIASLNEVYTSGKFSKFERRIYFQDYLLKVLAGFYSFKTYYKISCHPGFKNDAVDCVDHHHSILKDQYYNKLINSKHCNPRFIDQLKERTKLIAFKRTVYFIRVPQGLKRQAKYKSLAYLINYFNRMGSGHNYSENRVEETSEFYWSCSKTNLVELICSLHHSNCIEGYDSFNELVFAFEKFFNIELGQFRKTIFEINQRNQGVDKFLMQLAEQLRKQNN